MTPVEAAYVARLRARANTLAPDLARAEIRAYEMIREVLTERELAEAIQSGRMDALLDQVLNDTGKGGPFSRLRARLDQATMDAAKSEAAHLPSWMRPTAFNVLSPHVVEAVTKLDTRVVDGLKDEVRETVRTQVRLGLEAGKNPRVIARELRPLIGLAPNQAKAVANFRAQLEAGDRAALSRVLGRGTIRQPDGTEINRSAHANGQGVTGRDMGLLDRLLGNKQLSPEQIDRMTEAYRKRMHALNAETHARTMALDSQKVANRLSWEDAAERGIVAKVDLRRVWVAVLDDRTRDEHRELHGTEVGFDEAFPNGQVTPGETDYNCRCLARVVYRPNQMEKAA